MAERTKSTKLRRFLPWSLAATVLLLFLVFALRPQPQPADFATVERGPLAITVDEEGETRVRERYVVSAPVAGQVLRIELEPGDPVAAGETVLAVFQPGAPQLLDARSRAEAEARARAARAALGQAQADLERARAELRYAEAELARMRQLAADEIISRSGLDIAELEAETRRQAVEAAAFAERTARFELETVRAALVEGDGRSGARAEPIVIKALTDGVVLRRLRESEAMVPAGEPLLEIADPNQLEIVSDLLSSEAVKVSAGDPVAIEHWGGETPLQGRVRRVEPAGFTKISALGVEEQRVNVIIDFADPQAAWSALGDGYRVEVRIVIWQDDDVLKAPTSSLFRHPDAGGWAVWKVVEGTARLQPVTIGHRSGLEAEVLEGLAVDDPVIVHPSDKIAEGVAVEART